ncbi:MAG: hypothetical protein ACOYY2_02935 [Actinomycetota bacterium]
MTATQASGTTFPVRAYDLLDRVGHTATVHGHTGRLVRVAPNEDSPFHLDILLRRGAESHVERVHVLDTAHLHTR